MYSISAPQAPKFWGISINISLIFNLHSRIFDLNFRISICISKYSIYISTFSIYISRSFNLHFHPICIFEFPMYISKIQFTFLGFNLHSRIFNLHLNFRSIYVFISNLHFRIFNLYLHFSFTFPKSNLHFRIFNLHFLIEFTFFVLRIEQFTFPNSIYISEFEFIFIL